MQVTIFDKIELTSDSKRVFTDEGFLKVPGRIGRTGIQEYYAGELDLKDRDPDDILKIYRPESEVFNPASMESFASKPVTNNHPPEPVNIDNIKDYQAGYSGSIVQRVNDEIEVDLIITDKKLLESIKSGKVQISNGYTADITLESGTTPNGTAYDGIQTNIKGNHIAIVDAGRAGKTCKIADSKLDKKKNKQKEVNMNKILLDGGITIEVSDQAKEAIEKLQGEKKALNDSISSLKESHSSELATVQAERDEAQKKILSDEQKAEMIADAVKERAELTDKVAKVKKDYVVDWSKSVNQIKAEVCDIDLAEKGDAYVCACFDIRVSDAEGKGDGAEEIVVKDSVNVIDENDGRNKRIAKQKELNKK